MAVKDPKKTARILSILCIFIGLAAPVILPSSSTTGNISSLLSFITCYDCCFCKDTYYFANGGKTIINTKYD